MNEELLKLLEKLPKDKRWIFLMNDSTQELDVVSNMGDLKERRQLLAKVDVVWEDIIEQEKAKSTRPVDRDAFKSK
jgi:hypothetical protein